MKQVKIIFVKSFSNEDKEVTNFEEEKLTSESSQNQYKNNLEGYDFKMFTCSLVPPWKGIRNR